MIVETNDPKQLVVDRSGGGVFLNLNGAATVD
jgi:hypothetical protein